MVDAKPAVVGAAATGGVAGASAAAAAAGERSKIKLFMGRTPSIGVLKTKFLTVLGNSNELLNGISNKLTLSTSSSDSDYCDDEEDLPKFDETIDYTKIDFEARRVKARRAHEEIISGRYRQPNLAPRPRLDNVRKNINSKALRSSSSSSSSSSSDSSSSISLPDNVTAGAGVERSHVSSTTRSDSIESRHSGGYERNRAIAGSRRSELDIQKDMLRINELLSPCVEAPQIDVQPPSDREYARQMWAGAPSSIAGAGGTTTALNANSNATNSMRVPPRSRTSNSSTLTSLRDDPEMQISPSVESTDWRNFIRSESQNSVPSWASSISLDCRAGEEPVKEFMKNFTDALFNNTTSIDLELKSEFGVMVRLEIGRQWFTRFLLEQKLKSKRVDELTFHYLVQYFSIALFECGESEDYVPAALIMNLCFLFYHEIEVPGCDPYREYLFIFMRQQPIWHMLRFWNAACFEAMQTEREHRLTARLKRAEKRQQKKKSKDAAFSIEDNVAKIRPPVTGVENIDKPLRKPADSSSSSSHHSNALVVRSNVPPKTRTASITAAAAPVLDMSKDHDDIAFRQLSAFTCNMHTLGVPRDLCLEFLKKQMVSVNLTKDKARLIRDNIHRMYHESELWGIKET